MACRNDYRHIRHGGDPLRRAGSRCLHATDPRDSATSRISVANYLELSMVIEKQLGPEGMRQADAFFRRTAIEQGRLAGQAPRFREEQTESWTEFRRLLRLCSCQGFRRAVAIQGQRLHRDRHPFGCMTRDLAR